MNGFPRLFRQFILRALVREKTRTAVAVVAIASGVAVMVAIRLANTSATDSFRTAVESLSGDAQLRIVGTAGPFDELLLRDMTWLGQFATASPVVESYAMKSEGRRVKSEVKAADGSSFHSSPFTVHSSPEWPARGEFLHVLGVDILQDTPLRKYTLLETNTEKRHPSAQELLRLLTDADAIILTEKFARREGYRIGQQISLVFGSARKDFVIRGLLLDEGPARAMDGNFALLDIAAAQWACGRLGLLDHIDLKLRPGLDRQAAEHEIGRRLPAGLRVETPGEQYGRTDTMIAAFHFNLAALSAIALLVGLFLIYNTVAMSVAARREEIAMLQAVGSGRGMVLALFLGEAFLLAGAGMILGLVLGRWLAGAAVSATAETVETFYIAETARASARQLALSWGEIGLVAALALPLALVAAAVPAMEAARLHPVDVIRGSGGLVRSFRPPRRHLAIFAALAGVGWLLTRLGPVHDRPVFGFLAEFVFMLAGAMLVPGVLWLACQFVRRVAARAMGRLKLECDLAGTNLLGAIPKVSISVAALAVSLAMMIAISVMVSSFRDTVVFWLDSTLNPDLVVRPAMLTSSVADVRIDPEAVRRIQGDAAVAGTTWVTSRQVLYADRSIRLAATSWPDMLRFGRPVFKEPADGREAVRRDQGVDCVLVSESFSLRFRKHPGDMVELPTPEGPRRFRVTAVFYDYSSNQGTAMLDTSTYARHFRRVDPSPAPISMSIYLKPGSDPEQVRRRLIEEAGDDQHLYFRTIQSVRREALRIFDSTFTITYALEIIAIVVAGLGVISTLITLIRERQREIALVALVGATRRQIRRMVVIEAVMVGGASQLVGTLAGLVLAVVLIYVINVQSFGWTIQFHLPVGFLVQSTLLILAATALCGLYPAVRAANVDALRVVREE